MSNYFFFFFDIFYYYLLIYKENKKPSIGYTIWFIPWNDLLCVYDFPYNLNDKAVPKFLLNYENALEHISVLIFGWCYSE